MINFEIQSLESALVHAESSANAIEGLFLKTSMTKTYTGSLTINSAFSQHVSFMQGQAFSIERVCHSILQLTDWLYQALEHHTNALRSQEELSEARLQNLYDPPAAGLDYFKLRYQTPQRPMSHIGDLLYAPNSALVESTTPLASLIAQFTADDTAPITAATQWAEIATQIDTAIDHLRRAEQAIASNQGTQFDAARSAFNDVIQLGTTVATNARLMEQSVNQFPIIRSSNLAALHAIQAATATITEPAQRLAAEQAAVTHFVSTQLQPSLELVRPPVTNFGQPVIGHHGGETLSTQATDYTNNRVSINSHTPLQQTTTSPATTHMTQSEQPAPQNHAATNTTTKPEATNYNDPTLTPTNPSALTTHPAATTHAPIAPGNINTTTVQPNPTAANVSNSALTALTSQNPGRTTHTGTQTNSPTASTRKGLSPNTRYETTQQTSTNGRNSIKRPLLPHSIATTNGIAPSPNQHTATNHTPPAKLGQTTTNSSNHTSNNQHRGTQANFLGTHPRNSSRSINAQGANSKTNNANTRNWKSQLTTFDKEYFRREFFKGALKRKLTRTTITRG